ncbi:type II 3-dehydroquinate dehydratase [Roseospira marina]|uniref:3-dehydroquinate dehydratase n=1 Tax=Roseospira marina TaxID=140057 RepID=A0A5M6IES0_9PROT|nr:type II 3-dehydroquinate dehydratase [Roseospira marina]KAA5606771.1 type II 3-dehydroquinate dehydratase [Roseospira marina]MBB4313807.1 3-dehydroquinate dehydratase-2 [Roseospira marina]MBB5086969.1 3-dehydroquinate dehydratase-2 [Roseospira marina]
MPTTVLILNGPNLNLLGRREPTVYGRETLDDIAMACRAHGDRLRLRVDFRQSNHEGELVDWIQQTHADVRGIILNAAAYTHTSIAIPDALRAVGLPTIEVHLSNIHARESYRHHSFIAPVARGSIIGLGSQGYLLALDALARMIADEQSGVGPIVSPVPT